MPEPADAAWQRLLTACGRLVEAADALDDAGGIHRLAPLWRPAVRQKARETLAEARKAIDAQLALLRAGPPRG